MLKKITIGRGWEVMEYRSVCVYVYMYLCMYLQTTHTPVLEKEKWSKYESTSGRREDVSLRQLEDKAWILLQPKESLKPAALM